MGDLTLKVSKDLAPIPYQRQPSLDTLLSKLRILGQKAVAGMDRLIHLTGMQGEC